MISLTTLMILTKIIYLQLFKFIIRDEKFFVINVTITRLFTYLLRKSISFIFHVFDI